MFGSLFHSFILAQVFGLYMVITAVIALSKVSYFRDIVQRLNSRDLVLVMWGAMGLMFGLFLVDIHNFWVWQPRLLVTFVCWLILIKSILWLVIPEAMIRFTQRVVKGVGYYVAAVFQLALGMLLMAKGYYLYMSSNALI